MAKTSSKPRKQRLLFYSMPMHERQKSVASNLSSQLRKSIGKRALPLRKGDRVKVMRGSHKGVEGKVARIDYNSQQVFLEKLVRKKSDGTEKALPLHASNLKIVDLDKSDARRITKGKTEKVKQEKPAVKKESSEKKKEDKKAKVKKNG